MASTHEYYWRKHYPDNTISEWKKDEENGLYQSWISAYFQQPIRDQSVLIVVADPQTGYEKTLRCMADSNEKITGITFGGVRMEIVWGSSDQIPSILQRYP